LIENATPQLAHAAGRARHAARSRVEPVIRDDAKTTRHGDAGVPLIVETALKLSRR